MSADAYEKYGPLGGSAETHFWYDELFVSTKAGYRMWPGPYGDGGSRKYLLASLDLYLRKRYRVLTATSGADGIRLLRAHPEIDVVMSDMRMPATNPSSTKLPL